MNHITYTAANLEDIAKMFDEFVRRATNAQVGAATVKAGARAAGEAYAWREAAAILRATTIRAPMV